MSQRPLGSIVVDTFPVWESDGYTKKSGETSFVVGLWKDGVLSAVSVAIAEVGSSGMYKAEFTPDGRGVWYLEVKIPYNGQVWKGEYEVSIEQAEAQMNASYDEGSSTLFLEVWLDRDGDSIPAAELVSASVVLYEHDNPTPVFSGSSSTVKSDGRISFQTTLSLNADRPYNATVTATDARGSVTTYQAFTTVD